jgi:signal transduction histidine kinase
MARKRNLRVQLLFAALLPVVAFTFAFALVVTTVGYTTEDIVFRRMVAGTADELAQSWPDSSPSVQLRPGIHAWRDSSQIPAVIRQQTDALPAGVHELYEVQINGQRAEFFVAIRELPGRNDRLVVAQDVVQFEATESDAFFYWSIGIGVLLSMVVLAVSVRNCLRVLGALNQLEILADYDHEDGHEPPALEAFHDDEIGRIARRWKSARDRVLDVLARQKRFTRDASHELRTPLTAMRSSIELLETLPKSDDIARIVARLRLATDEMLRLIQAFLWLARDEPSLDSNESVHLVRVIHRCVEELPLVFRGGRERVSVDMVGTAEAHAPLAVVEIVIRNLILNALGHSGEDQVFVRLREQHLVVRNRVCEDSVDDSCKGSFGFGLSIVTSLCERFGWELTVDPNQDSMFIVSVKFAEPIRATASQESTLIRPSSNRTSASER